MRRTWWVTAMLVLALAAPVLAQVAAPGRGHGIGGARPAPATPEDEKAAPVTDVPRRAEPAKATGQVESLALQPGMGGRLMLQTALLKTRDGSVTVLLGPVWYMRQQQFPLNVGDTWEVAGFKTTMDGKPALAAREVKKGAQVLKLRDERGQPLWAGAGRGTQGPK